MMALLKDKKASSSSDDLVKAMPRFLFLLQVGPRWRPKPRSIHSSYTPTPTPEKVLPFSINSSPLQRPAPARPGRALVSRYLRPYCQLGGKQWPHWTLEATSSSLLFQPQNVGSGCRMGPGPGTPATSTGHARHGSDAGYASLTGETL